MKKFNEYVEYKNLNTKFQSFWPTDAFEMFPHIVCPQTASADATGYIVGERREHRKRPEIQPASDYLYRS